MPGDSQEAPGLPTVAPGVPRILGLHPLSLPQNFLLSPTEWRSGPPETEQEDLGMGYTKGAPRGRELLRPENSDTLDAMKVVRGRVFKGIRLLPGSSFSFARSLEESMMAKSSCL